jgi:short-subunit dehydrogenase
MKETVAHFGGIDVLVNNAGYSLVGPFEASTDEQIRRQFDTNVFGLMNVTREIIPYFRERKAGTIINVASVGGRITFPLYSLYHGTKWAVEGFSESLQHELRQFGIKIKIIEPGPVKTDFYSRSQDLMRKAGLFAYDPYINRTMPTMQKSGEKGSPPEYRAGVIYKAATDGSWRLRFAAGGNAGSILFLRKILPDGMFNGFVRGVVEKG